MELFDRVFPTQQVYVGQVDILEDVDMMILSAELLSRYSGSSERQAKVLPIRER